MINFIKKTLNINKDNLDGAQMEVNLKNLKKDQPDHHQHHQPDYHHHHIIIIVVIINITRPKPAYGRQGLAGSWGQHTDEVSTSLVLLTSHFAHAALSSDLTNLGQLMTMKIHLETLKKPWKPTKNHEKP